MVADSQNENSPARLPTDSSVPDSLLCDAREEDELAHVDGGAAAPLAVVTVGVPVGVPAHGGKAAAHVVDVFGQHRRQRQLADRHRPQILQKRPVHPPRPSDGTQVQWGANISVS